VSQPLRDAAARDPAPQSQPEREQEGAAPMAASQALHASPHSGTAQHVLALQRGAGNAAVSRWLTASPQTMIARDDGPATATPPAGTGTGTGTPAAPPVPRVSYVFLMGDFKNDNFYLAAKEYFAHKVPGAVPVYDKRTLADVIAHVNAQGKPVDTLFIVSHANESGNLGFSLDKDDLAKDKSTGDKKPRTEFKEVKEANDKGSLPTADVKLIDAQTKVEIKGCNVGRSTLMMDELDEAFGGEASVTAPTHTQEYRFHGNKKAGVSYEENFAEMFVEEVGVATKSPAELEAAFKAKYAMVPTEKWPALLKTVKKEDATRTLYTWNGINPPEDNEKSVLARIEASKKWPKSQKWVVSYQGRETVGDMYKFNVHAERVTPDGGTAFEDAHIMAKIPPDDATLIAQEKAKHGRPDAVNWRVKRTPAGTALKLEVIAERTEWVIDGTIKDAAGPFHPKPGDKDWLTTSTYTPPPPPTPPPTTP
jgi:hypothetical protein